MSLIKNVELFNIGIFFAHTRTQKRKKGLKITLENYFKNH